MHVRVSRVTRNGKTYAYAQLVESFRRPDGVPAHRVVANLGSLAPEQIENLKLALAAGRSGERLAVASQKAPRSPLANLRYLDLAVLLELARDWRLDQLLGSLLPKDNASVAPSDVVVALALQRCVDPGSKLYAERWFPRTALPELLGVAPESFNNTRLHRVLEQLDAVTPELMARLPSLYLEQSHLPAFAAMYVDLTDAFFVGHGPNLAVRAKTKEGFVARKIGILLLCNEQGYPLRWRIVEGNRADSEAITELFEQIAKTPWAQKTPIVCDRAMGRTALVRAMAATGLHFLTALATTEFESYAPALPLASFHDLKACEPTEQARLQAIEQACERARDAGFERVSDSLWVIDYGVVDVGSARVELNIDLTTPHSTTAHALRVARDIVQAVHEGRFSTFAAAGRFFGLMPGVAKKYRRLLELAPDIQQAIADGEADRCSLGELLRLRSYATPEEQRQAFGQLLVVASARAPRGVPVASKQPPTTNSLRVRVIACFNPECFVDQRQAEARQRAAIDTFVRDLNARLAGARSKLDEAGIRAAIDRRLRRDDLLDAYEVHVEPLHHENRRCLRVTLEPVAKAWERRRRNHGLSVLVGHADLPQSAQELSRLYRSKDRVEKDFQTIKSLVELRPIRHRNDDKVRAHITVCMLALLLERWLDEKLGNAHTALSALEELATCHLNQYEGKHGACVYAITQPTRHQQALLRKLGLRHLADPGRVSSALTLTPRLHLQS